MATRRTTSGQTIQRLADATTAEGLLYVRARRVVEALWKNGERYHAGEIDYSAWSARNHDLWDQAEDGGLETEVKRQLRNR